MSDIRIGQHTGFLAVRVVFFMVIEREVIEFIFLQIPAKSQGEHTLCSQSGGLLYGS